MVARPEEFTNYTKDASWLPGLQDSSLALAIDAIDTELNKWDVGYSIKVDRKDAEGTVDFSLHQGDPDTAQFEPVNDTFPFLGDKHIGYLADFEATNDFELISERFSFSRQIGDEKNFDVFGLSGTWSWGIEGSFVKSDGDDTSNVGSFRRAEYDELGNQVRDTETLSIEKEIGGGTITSDVKRKEHNAGIYVEAKKAWEQPSILGRSLGESVSAGIRLAPGGQLARNKEKADLTGHVGSGDRAINFQKNLRHNNDKDLGAKIDTSFLLSYAPTENSNIGWRVVHSVSTNGSKHSSTAHMVEGKVGFGDMTDLVTKPLGAVGRVFMKAFGK